MEIINNRYRVLKFIKQNKFTSSYLVYDLILQNRVILNVINFERVPKSLIDYYIEEFVNWTNVDSPRINSVYEFGTISLVDNKKLNDIKYFYTNQYYDTSKCFEQIAQKIEEEEDILNIFIKLCEAVDYLHLKGFTYNELNFNNVCIGYGQEEQDIRLKDIPTIKLEKLSHASKESMWTNKAKTEGPNRDIGFDIHALGVILFYLCITGCVALGANILKMKNIIFKKGLSKEFLKNIENIIRKCILRDNGYCSVREIVKDINCLLGTQYQLKDIKEVKKINLNLKLVGRSEEVNLVMKDYTSILPDNSQDKVVLVHGDTGIGKTKFLNSINNILTYNRANVYAGFSLNNRENQPFKEILKQIIAQCEPKVLEKYEEDLVRFIPEIQYSQNLIHTDTLDISKERLKLLNRISGFINDFTKYKPITIIIDDIHLADDFSIQLLNYLCNRQIKNKSIMLVLSYCEGRHILNKNTLQLIETIKFRSNVRNIRLKGLTEEQTGEMIKYILGMHQVPKKFSNIIYCKSYGNPLFIQEVIKDFYYKEIIYVNNKTGDWQTNYSYHEFPIPSDINQILLNQIQDIDDISYNILSIMSIFLTPISVENIIFMSGYLREDVEPRVNSMLNKGLLCKKIGDQGFVYELYNRLLKDLIYERIGVEERKNKHKLAAEFMEKQYMEGYEQYIEELIYHLQKAQQNEKFINYCVQNANKMKKFNNYIEAIKNLKNAIEILPKNSPDDRKLQIIVEIVGLYGQIGEFNEAIKYLRDLEEVAKKLNNFKYQVYSLNKRAAIYFERNNIGKLEECVEKVSKIVDKDEDLENYLEYRLMLARLYDSKGKHDESYNICIQSIELCTEEYKAYKGLFYNLIGYIFITKSQIVKAEEALKNSIEVLSKSNSVQGLVKALNNMGVVYGDYYQNTEKAAQFYMKIRGICKKNNLVISEIIAINNLGEGYFYEQDYYSALSHFHEVEEKSRKYDIESSLFYAYIFLSKTYLRIGNYHKAYEYCNLANKELGVYTARGTDMLEYYKACGELHLEFGDAKKAKIFIEKALNSNDNDESLLKINNQFLLKYIELLDGDEIRILEILKDIREILSKITTVSVRIGLLCKVAWFLYNKELYSQGKEVLEEIRKLSKKKENLNYLEIYIKYLEALYCEEDKIKGLENVLNLAKRDGNKKLESEIYRHIGRYYFNKKDYFNSFVYYFECCEVLLDLIKQLPREYKKSFMNFYDVNKIIYRLKDIKEYYYRNNGSLKELDTEEINLDEITSVLSFINCKDIMDNRYFMKSVKNFYSSLFHNEIHDIRDVLNNITSNELSNLSIILQYMLYVTMGTNAYIIEEQDCGFQQMLCSENDKLLTEEDYAIINRCKSKKETILVSNIENYKGSKEESFKDIKACICMPIILPSAINKQFENENRHVNIYDDTTIMAYVYIRSERALNNFTLKTLKKCSQLNGLIGFTLEKYKLNKIAPYDKLTSTLTRKYLEEEIERNLDIAAENNGVFSMLMFDLDHFKGVNDKFGHQTGDEVLREVCSIVRNNIRATDICGRYGGEEFIILLKNIDVDNAKNVAEKLRKKIEEAKILGDKQEITVSMGIVGYPEHGQWKQELIEKVDQALYVAKERGRNQCSVWKEDVSSKVKVTNKLTGIITGNEVQNNRNVLVMVELIELLNKNLDFKEKIYRALGRIIEITESQYGMLFQIEDGNIKEIFSRKAFEEQWINNISYNRDIIKSVLDKRHGIYTIDWDNVIQRDPITGTPDWQSLILVPIIKNEIIKGVLYLSVSSRNKEFGFEDFNFVETLVKIISNMM